MRAKPTTTELQKMPEGPGDKPLRLADEKVGG